MRLVGSMLMLSLAGCAQPSRSDASQAHNTFSLAVNFTMPVGPETWSRAGTLTCRFQVRQSCDPNGCDRAVPTVFVRWTPTTSTYERCDERGCDRYQAEVSYSGIFANIALPQNGAIARLSEDGVMMEIITVGMGAMVQYGRCA